MVFDCQALTSLVIKAYYRAYHDAIDLKKVPNDIQSLRSLLSEYIENDGLRVRQNIYLPQICGSRFIGFSFMDLVVEDLVALAIMNRNSLPLQQIQLLRTFLSIGDLPVGLLVIFKAGHPDFRQVENPAISIIRFMG